MNIAKVKTLLKEYVILEKMKDDFDIEPAKIEDVEVFIKRHYLKTFPTGISKIYAVYQKQQEGKHMVGMIIFGNVFPTASKFLLPLVTPPEMQELKRLYLDDINVRNLESFVIASALKLLQRDMPQVKAVVTFADSNQGHVGAIYQATNAKYIGISNGKHKYVYVIGGDVSAITKKLEDMTLPYPKKDEPEDPLPTQLDKVKEEIARFEKNTSASRPYLHYFGMIKKDELRGTNEWFNNMT